jgi:hypothetical protein
MRSCRPPAPASALERGRDAPRPRGRHRHWTRSGAARRGSRSRPRSAPGTRRSANRKASCALITARSCAGLNVRLAGHRRQPHGRGARPARSVQAPRPRTPRRQPTARHRTRSSRRRRRARRRRVAGQPTPQTSGLADRGTGKRANVGGQTLKRSGALVGSRGAALPAPVDQQHATAVGERIQVVAERLMVEPRAPMEHHNRRPAPPLHDLQRGAAHLDCVSGCQPWFPTATGKLSRPRVTIVRRHWGVRWSGVNPGRRSITAVRATLAISLAGGAPRQ